MMKLVLFVVALAAVVYGHHEGPSPCKDFFEYSATHLDANQWEGTLKLKTDYTLHGLWIRLILDKPAKDVKVLDKEGFEVVVGEQDSSEYLIKNRDYLLKKSTPTDLKFAVSFEGEKDKQPNLVGYRLNGRTFCPIGQE